MHLPPVLSIMSGLLSHSKNSIPVWFRLFWQAEELHALSYALLLYTNCYLHNTDPTSFLDSNIIDIPLIKKVHAS